MQNRAHQPMATGFYRKLCGLIEIGFLPNKSSVKFTSLLLASFSFNHVGSSEAAKKTTFCSSVLYLDLGQGVVESI